MLNKKHIFLVVLFIVFNSFIYLSCDPEEDGKPTIAVTLQEKMVKFSDYDYDNDGMDEIEYLEFADFENPETFIPPESSLILVMIEPRLLEVYPDTQPGHGALLERLQRFKYDLNYEGYTAICINALVYGNAADHTRHQDGLTLLALREFFKSVKGQYPRFKGVIFVGSFPEAMVVRRSIWRKDTAKEDGDFVIGGETVPGGTSYLSIEPGIIADRAELVLADLDGNWQNLYHMGPENIESIKALPDYTYTGDWPLDNTPFYSKVYEFTNQQFEDFFFIQDDDVISRGFDPFNHLLSLTFHLTDRNPELNAIDMNLANPIARPDILISRINARHIAVNPDPNLIDKYGQGFLDSNGKPQIVEFNNEVNLSNNVFWKRDPLLERRVLIDYFDRNHQFRTGVFSTLTFAETAIGYDLSAEVMHDIIKDSAQFEDYSYTENANLSDYTLWLQKPGVLRGIAAHSGPTGSIFKNISGTIIGAVFEMGYSTGPNPWRWKPVPLDNSYRYEPSFSEQGGGANFHLYRTLWENKKLEGNGAYLYVHNGCRANSPLNAHIAPYNSQRYGIFQNMECLMFYCNGLAVLSRAKVFNDSPYGFSNAFKNDHAAPFGAGWKAYFDRDTTLDDLATVSIKRKRTYTWSIIGDWTLQLDYQ